MQTNPFAALGVSAELAEALDARGIVAPFQIQTRAIPPALAGTDLLAKSPTGSGKTLAFAIPLVERVPRDDARPAALVLVPTRELCVQVTEEIEFLAAARGLVVASVYGGVALRPQANLARDAHVIVATPGRLQDLLDRRLLTLDAVEILVLDEADRMLDMGFKPQVDRIVKRLSRERQTMFFSATLDGEVGELARAYTQSPARIEAELPSDREPGEIDHHFVSVTPDTKVTTLVELLEAERGLALVFVRTKRGADRLARKLTQQGVKAVAMHGDLRPGPAAAGARAVRERRRHDADRDRRRRPRPRPRRRHARDQLRSARGRQGVHAPGRPHGPRGALGHGRHARAPRAAGRHEPRRTAERPARDVRVDRHAHRRAEARLLVAPSRQVGPEPASPQDLT